MVRDEQEIINIAKYIARRPKAEEIIHMMLTRFSLVYNLNQAVFFELDDNERFFTAVQAVGSTNQGEIDNALFQMKDKSLEHLIANYNPEADRNLNEKVKDFVVLSQVPSVVNKELMEKKSSTYINNQELSDITEEDKKLVDKFGTDKFILIPIRGNEEQLIGFVYGNNAVTGADIQGDRNKVDLALSLGSIALQRLKDEREISEKTGLAVIGKLTAQIAHEIKNPLVNMGGFARSIKKYAGNPDRTDDIRESANIILEEVGRLETLLQDSLMFVREKKPILEKIDLYEMCKNAVNLIPNTDDIGIEIRYDEPVFAYADPNQIKQVLLNLGKNAIEAMETDLNNPRNTLRIEVGYESKSYADETKMACAGFFNPQYIPEAEREKVFDPQYTTKVKGTGLGLAVCKEIIQKNEGIIECRSSSKEGTSFKFWVPAYSGQDDAQKD